MDLCDDRRDKGLGGWEGGDGSDGREWEEDDDDSTDLTISTTASGSAIGSDSAGDIGDIGIAGKTFGWWSWVAPSYRECQWESSDCERRCSDLSCAGGDGKDWTEGVYSDADSECSVTESLSGEETWGSSSSTPPRRGDDSTPGLSFVSSCPM